MKRINEAHGAPGVQREFRGFASSSLSGVAHATSGTGSLADGEVKSLMTRRPLRASSRLLLNPRERR